MRKPLVYLAGPYSKPDPMENIHAAAALGAELLDAGLVVPLIPHTLTGMWHLVTPRPYETWLAYDAELVTRCDAVLRFGGESSGADREVALAHDEDIPVFTSVADLYEWVGWRKRLDG